MIIVTSQLNIKEALQYYRPDDYNFYEFNLSCLVNVGYSLAPLIPDPNYIPEEVLKDMESEEFARVYGEFVLNNREQFMTFMALMLPLYNDPLACVIIYTSSSPYRDLLCESLIKLIQQRYGYSSYIVNTIDDMLCVGDNMSFSPRGILMIQEDSDKALMEGYYGAITAPPES